MGLQDSQKKVKCSICCCFLLTSNKNFKKMPKSKRAKVVPLTKTKAKPKEQKDTLISRIRDSLEGYNHVYTFTLHNVRTSILQQIREERREDSKLFLGNNKIMMIGLGKSEETSAKPNLFKLSKFLSGLCGLLLTNLPKKEVKDYFSHVGEEVFARTGHVAATSFVVPPGPLPQFPHAMFDHLLKLGLPVKLDKGIIILLQETTVCEEGDTLSAEAAQILKLFGLQTAQFRIELTAHWNNGVAKKISLLKRDEAQEE